MSYPEEEFANGKTLQSKAVLRAGRVGEARGEIEGAADGSAKLLHGEWFVNGQHGEHGERSNAFANTRKTQRGREDDDGKPNGFAIKEVQHVFNLHSRMSHVGGEEIGRRVFDGIPNFVAIGKF